jgi:phage tail-like protein
MASQDMTNSKSSYLQYLPPVLWMEEPEPPEFSLGRFLLAFEKILTGLDGQPSVAHKGYQHASLEQTLDELHKLYNPFKLRSHDSTWLEAWLKYLASWVGLELLPDWDEYQKRKLIGDAVHIYNLRGRKQGILKALEIYVVSELKPRIAIDTGESVFRVPLEGERAGQAHVVSSGPPILHPLSVTIDRTNRDPAYRGRIIIGDTGSPNFGDLAKLWRITASGELDYQLKDGRIVPVPLYDSSVAPDITRLMRPVAVIDDPAGFYAVADEGLGVLAKILRVAKSPPHVVTLVWQGDQDQSDNRFVGMTRDAEGNYVVLDRGDFTDFPTPARRVKILVINPEAAPGGTPSGAVLSPPLELESVVAPTAIAIHPDGDYIVADAGNPNAGEPTEIYKISRAGETNALLAGLPEQERPVFPTSLYVEDEGHILILDYGVKELAGATQPAVVWRLSLPPASPRLEAVSRDVSYVRPTDMTTDLKGNLILVDHGDFADDRDWRRHPHEFGVVLHFAQAFPGIERTVRAISDIVHAEKPAGSRFRLKR